MSTSSWVYGNSPFQRKRTLSSLDDEDSNSNKRLRRQSTLPFDTPLSPGPSRASLTRTRSMMDEAHEELARVIHSSPRRPRLSGASSSFIYSNSPSRASSIAGDTAMAGSALMRSSSIADLRRKRESMTPAEPTYAPHSAYHVLRSVNTIDYSVASAGDAADSAPASPVSWSQSNAVVFGRGNRVHYKNMADTEDVAQQLCKITGSLGSLRLVQCGGKDQSNIVALATSGGGVQLWDLVAKKMVCSWKMKNVTSMCFGENMLTIGDEKGTLRHYDTRVLDPTKMKEQLKKVTRHQGRILKAAWKEDGKHLATGDQNGLVLVWDARRPRVPLEVGEMVQRRRKMQHVGAVTALAWCPWQTKYLVTGDSTTEGTGTIRVWDVVDDSPSTEWPTRIELDAQVTSLHFSPHIRELLSTHGSGKTAPAPVTPTTPSTPLDDPFASASIVADPFTSRISNSVVVHQFPTMRHVTTVSVAKSNVAGSVLSPNGHRIVFAVPDESQLKVWEVWGKFKAPKPPSLYETCAIR
ncbi:hypothetical protein ONZ51_g6092 [Trametes cubensis]|uniref:WD40 repeat-like protein n=1 Tax=Trametes cubensis TaxID=1111947 RepID=A0AAD7XAC9_9APHY|nr:hypothetical protein ONZ51_g6092 [Trametes cubensis]